MKIIYIKNAALSPNAAWKKYIFIWKVRWFLIQEELYTKNPFKSIFLVIMESFILFQPKIYKTLVKANILDGLYFEKQGKLIGAVRSLSKVQVVYKGAFDFWNALRGLSWLLCVVPFLTFAGAFIYFLFMPCGIVI